MLNLVCYTGPFSASERRQTEPERQKVCEASSEHSTAESTCPPHHQVAPVSPWVLFPLHSDAHEVWSESCK